MKYEYKFTEVSLSKGIRVHEEHLNDLGMQGWEAVSVWPEQKGAGTVARMLLKRPMSSKQAYRQKRGWFKMGNKLGWSLR